MLEIANGKLAEETIVVFLGELVVPREIVGLGRVIVFAQELVRRLENVELCREGGGG